MKKVVLSIDGMTCSACSNGLEKYLNKQNGIKSATVNLVMANALIEYDENILNLEKIEEFVEEAGFKSLGIYNENSEKKQNKNEKVKFIIFSVLAVALMYISMGHMIGLPNFSFLDMHMHPLIYAGTLLALTIAFVVYGFDIIKSGFKNLIHKAPNMDTLVALGSGAAFVYSTYALFAMTDAQVRMDMDGVMHYMHEFYFESAAMILTLITVGKMLEAHSKGKTTDAIKSLMKLAPKTANIIRDGSELNVPVENVKKGDIFIVRPGENIPVDGIVVEGNSAVNEAALTGESIPVDKSAGDNVSAATLNQSGFLKCEASRVGEDTTLSQIIQMVSDAAATKAPIAKIADRVSGVFVPAVITIALITIAAWLIAGQSVGFALARGISVLVISCPCALGLATPVAIMVGNGMGAKNGMMFKTASSLEETGKIDIVALDKTGTITSGEPKVTDIICADGFGKNDLLENAYSIEMLSEHPLAKAVTGYVKDNKRDIFNKKYNITEFQALAGNGLSGINGEDKITGGSLKFMSNTVNVPKEMDKKAQELAEQGKTPLLFAKNDKLSFITDDMLIAGCDIGSETHYIRAIDVR